MNRKTIKAIAIGMVSIFSGQVSASAGKQNIAEDSQSALYQADLLMELVKSGAIKFDGENFRISDETIKKLDQIGILQQMETQMAVDTDGWPLKTK